jgi:hypothetical protein
MHFQTFAIGEYPVGESLIGEIRESPNFNANNVMSIEQSLFPLPSFSKLFFNLHVYTIVLFIYGI